MTPSIINSEIYKRLAPDEAIGIPLVEVDPTVTEDTFCVASREFGQTYISRYSRLKSVYLFSPYNPVRRFAITVTSHVVFDVCLMIIVLANCVELAIPTLFPEIFDPLITVFYLAELLFQTISRGLIFGTFAYLRNPWQCLDFIVTVVSLAMMTAAVIDHHIEKIPEIQALRGLRALKAITKIPGVQTMAQGMLSSMSHMGGVSIIMFLCLTTIALLGKQVYMGVLLHKCVVLYTENSSMSYAEFINDPEHWQMNKKDEVVVCGNGSGAQKCDPGFACLSNIGPNPDHGYSNFDNFGWAFMNSFRILTQDAWEDLYSMILDSTGPLSMLFFVPTIFLGSFYLLNLMLAVVANAYEAVVIESNDSKKILSDYRDENVFRFDLYRLRLYPLPTNREILRRVLEERNELLAQRAAFGRGWRRLREILRGERLKVALEAVDADEQDKEISNSQETISPEVKDEKLGCWSRFRLKVRNFSDGKPFRHFIFICIVVNTIILASEHYGMSDEFRYVIQTVNTVVTVCFTFEEVVDLIAYGREYFYDWWNVLDFYIVVQSIVSLLLESISELSLGRSLKLLRLVKLSQSWTALRKVITVIFNSVLNIIKLMVVLAVMIFVFAVIGVRLLGVNYTKEAFEPDHLPRWSFTNFGSSLFTVFQIITGEWVEPLWDCMRAENVHIKCPFIIISYFLVGNFVILNLFIALLLSSFDSADLQFASIPVEDEETFFDMIKRICYRCLNFCRKKIQTSPGNGLAFTQHEKQSSEYTEQLNAEEKVRKEASKSRPVRRFCLFVKKLKRFVQSGTFEVIITVLICGSCITLSFEDINLPKHPARQQVIMGLNLFFTAAFTLEMLLKWFALGIKKYFSDAWTTFDFIVVVGLWTPRAVLHSLFSQVSIAEVVVALGHAPGNFRLGSLKALRALRPMRFIPRWKGMQMVVKALVMSLPAMCRVILVCMFIWLTFAILGVHLFAGRLFRCIDDEGDIADYHEITNKSQCLDRNYSWEQPFMNFDHIGNSYLSLFQLAMLEGWTEIVQTTVDIRGKDLQPMPNSSPQNYIYIISFILVGGFLTVNLFVGVVVDTFKDMKKHVETGVVELLLTDNQKRYFKAMLKLGKKKPKRITGGSKIPLLKFFYKITYTNWFQGFILSSICINAFTIAVESHNDPPQKLFILRTLDYVFQGIYTIEFVIKILGLRKFYFYDFWNVFDFVLWFSNSIGIALEVVFHKEMLLSLNVIYALRLLRILRLLRLAKNASDIRRLLFSLLASAPALLNISVLLFLLIFIYAIMGMELFAFVRRNGILTDHVNFETLNHSAMLLFRLTSAAGWEDVLEALSIHPPHCDPDPPHAEDGSEVASDCGSKLLAILYLLSFILLSDIILVNIFVAVILDSYESAVTEENEVISDDDLDNFYVVWSRYDPKATQFLSLELLSDFLDGLEESIRVPKPNQVQIAIMNLPHTVTNQVHCLDVLQGIVKVKVGDIEDTKAFDDVCRKLQKNFLKMFPRLKMARMADATLQIKGRDLAAKAILEKVKIVRDCKAVSRMEEFDESDISNRGFRLLASFMFLGSNSPVAKIDS